MSVTGTEAEQVSVLRPLRVVIELSAVMIPPQEASARRREIEDKLKQVKLGESEGRRGIYARGARGDAVAGRPWGWAVESDFATGLG